MLTRRWTWRQAASTRVEADTSRVFVNVDGLPLVGQSEVCQALDAVETLVARHCGGVSAGALVLGADQPTGRLTS